MSIRRSTTMTTAACVALGAACLLGLGPAAPAQQNSAFVDNSLSLQFDGGSPELFVKALREASGDVPVNVIVSGDTAGLVLPPITFERVTVLSAVMSLEHLNVEPYVINVNATDPNRETGVLAVAVFNRSSSRNAGPRVTQNSQQQLEVLSLTELLEGRADSDARANVDTLLTAIDTALKMDPDAKATELKFHPDSSLLIVRGNDNQTSLVKRLVNEVNHDVQRRRDFTNGLMHELRNAEIELQKGEIEMRAARGELDLAHTELGELGKLKDRGLVSETEIRSAEQRMQQLENQVSIIELELMQRAERVAALSDKLKSTQARFSEPTSEEAIRAEIQRLRDRISTLEAKLRAAGSSNRR